VSLELALSAAVPESGLAYTIERSDEAAWDLAAAVERVRAALVAPP
jgi:hypothetical protein